MARVAKQLLAQFEEDTAYERFVLDTVATAGHPPNPTTPPRDDLRGGGLSMARSTSDWLAADSVAQAIGSFRPLGFGAAYKVIDMLVELVMRVNQEPCPNGRWTFVEKQTYVKAGRPARLPIPLQVPRGYWPRITALYDRFLEPRHALVHRRATVQPDGTLAPTDRAGVALPTVSKDEQDAFVHLMRELGAAVIVGDTGRRRRNRIAWNLDLLRRHHCQRKLGARTPREAIREIVLDLDPAGPRRWKLDGSRVHAHLRGQHETPFDADLVAYATQGSEVAEYRAICDEVPEDQVEFDEAAPPQWLQRM